MAIVVPPVVHPDDGEIEVTRGISGTVMATVWIADVSPVEVKVIVYVPAPPVIARLLNVATPATAATLAVPERVPPTLTAAVTVAVLAVVMLPAASITDTLGCVAKTAPESEDEALVTMPSFDTAPIDGVTTVAMLVSPVDENVRV